jgi:hypothetical protein
MVPALGFGVTVGHPLLDLVADALAVDGLVAVDRILIALLVRAVRVDGTVLVDVLEIAVAEVAGAGLDPIWM